MIEKNELTSRPMAKTAGISLVIMFLATMIAEFYARQSLIVPNDAVKTAHTTLQNRFDFCVGIVGFVVVLICDILAVWALYFFLKPVNANLSLLAACVLCIILPETHPKRFSCFLKSVLGNFIEFVCKNWQTEAIFQPNLPTNQ